MLVFPCTSHYPSVYLAMHCVGNKHSDGQGKRLGRGPGAAGWQGAEGGGRRGRRPASAAASSIDWVVDGDGGDPQESKETYNSVKRDESAMSPAKTRTPGASRG